MLLQRRNDFIFVKRMWVWLAVIGLFAFSLSGASGIHAQDAPAVDVGLCTTTVEQLHGQGRFEMGGLSRFSFGGFEGGKNDLNQSGLDPAVIAQILGNRVTPNWLVGLLPLLASGPNFNSEPVAILVVDDFPDNKLTFNTMGQLPSKWRTQFQENNIVPTFPLEVPVVTHGMQVFLVMRDLLEALKAINPSVNVSLHRVDISVGGNYRLNLVAPAIAAKITELQGLGIDRFVINMSFGLIPCNDASSGFSFNDFAGMRAARLNDLTPSKLNQNFSFDLDGRTFEDLPDDLNGVNEVQVQNRPVVYQDYGLIQYLAEEVVDGTSQRGPGGQLLKELLSSPETFKDSDEPEMAALRTLLQGYLTQSASGDMLVIPVAASGNYADFVTPDAPLSPAGLPEVIAVGATLGEGGGKWEYSQAAHLLAPGAWYDYSTKTSFVAGTSFAAPMVSMIGALYLTYPDACTFDGTHPPILNLSYDNDKIKPYYTGFDCNPMLEPEDPVQLLLNRSFETRDIKNTSADRWKESKLVGDQRILNKVAKPPVAYFGNAAFQFNGTANTTSMIWQNADITPGFALGDKLGLGAQIEATNLTPGAGKIRVIVKYSDGTPAKTKELKIVKGTYSYTPKTMLIGLASANVKEIRVQIMMVNGQGRFRIDGISLEKIPAVVPLTLPDTGSDLRGGS